VLAEPTRWSSNAANVRLWPKADIGYCAAHVRCWEQSGHSRLQGWLVRAICVVQMLDRLFSRGQLFIQRQSVGDENTKRRGRRAGHATFLPLVACCDRFACARFDWSPRFGPFGSRTCPSPSVKRVCKICHFRIPQKPSDFWNRHVAFGQIATR